MSIFVDTSAWYALFDKNDSDHASAVRFKESLTHSLVTTNYVADEIITLVKVRLGHRITVEIGEKLWDESMATLIRVTSIDEKKAWEIFVKHRDKGFSFTDCTSFVVMERLGIIEAFAFDEHFEQYGGLIRLPQD
ncbi:MAG: PIN domain-containing protein [Euryarchaeota archaeon]|nr:PIN domain-containing protein [Euryarchaeota archaeon]MBU4491512.1 PIN domain-containing protein [Euryarchaeota archaeon]MCG2728525.1 PIN domain-containing protein [Candidatus Methanoperedenaceae archaeon]